MLPLKLTSSYYRWNSQKILILASDNGVIHTESKSDFPGGGTYNYVIQEIKKQADIFGVDEETALRIAFCESRYNPYATNDHSTATGVYQFISPTWDFIGATASRTDYVENIRQFMIWYPRFPSWWECS